ncbi:hypothetical protein EYB33_14690 [Lysinibacillus sphaericus]|uniref:hypothetical protein n=1 Tax=Lysinibacillus sphaericus TaxID=1421 RepID=UPI001E31C2F3|nr:hypothetical protein [Lysinibacillus sphaericus]UDK97478.1 hypothetical protein EYB33_14690 [Lysinibacillus sphaericus]
MLFAGLITGIIGVSLLLSVVLFTFSKEIKKLFMKDGKPPKSYFVLIIFVSLMVFIAFTSLWLNYETYYMKNDFYYLSLIELYENKNWAFVLIFSLLFFSCCGMYFISLIIVSFIHPALDENKQNFMGKIIFVVIITYLFAIITTSTSNIGPMVFGAVLALYLFYVQIEK